MWHGVVDSMINQICRAHGATLPATVGSTGDIEIVDWHGGARVSYAPPAVHPIEESHDIRAFGGRATGTTEHTLGSGRPRGLRTHGAFQRGAQAARFADDQSIAENRRLGRQSEGAPGLGHDYRRTVHRS